MSSGAPALEPVPQVGGRTSSTAAPRRRFHALRFSDRLWLKLAVGIPAALHIGLVWIPMFITLIFSLASWDNLAPLSTLRFVGFQNYWQILTIFDIDLFPALFNNLVLIIWLFVCSAIGMLFAYALDKNIKGSRFYQSVFYLPVVLSSAVVGFIWKAVMFNADGGLLNILWPGENVDFLGDGTKIFEITVPLLDFPLGLSRNFAAIMVATAWRHVGYIMVLYLAGLKAVDPSLREAAAIDGCNEWQSFRRVVFHALRPINAVVAVITMIEALRAYDIIASLGTQRGTEVIGTLVVSSLSGEGSGRVGAGSAYGMLLFLLCIGFIIYYVINNFRDTEP